MLTVIKPFCNEFHRENRMDLILSEASRQNIYLRRKNWKRVICAAGKFFLPSVCLKRGSIWNITGYWSISDERQAA